MIILSIDVTAGSPNVVLEGIDSFLFGIEIDCALLVGVYPHYIDSKYYSKSTFNVVYYDYGDY